MGNAWSEWRTKTISTPGPQVSIYGWAQDHLIDTLTLDITHQVPHEWRVRKHHLEKNGKSLLGFQTSPQDLVVILLIDGTMKVHLSAELRENTGIFVDLLKSAWNRVGLHRTFLIILNCENEEVISQLQVLLGPLVFCAHESQLLPDELDRFHAMFRQTLQEDFEITHKKNSSI